MISFREKCPRTYMCMARSRFCQKILHSTVYFQNTTEGTRTRGMMNAQIALTATGGQRDESGEAYNSQMDSIPCTIFTALYCAQLPVHCMYVHTCDRDQKRLMGCTRWPVRSRCCLFAAFLSPSFPAADPDIPRLCAPCHLA